MSILGEVRNGVVVLESGASLGEGTIVRVEPVEKDHAVRSGSPQVRNDALAHEIEPRFRQLAKTWKQETNHLSSSVRMAKHPAYLEIIALGKAVLPFLLAELRRDPDFWFAALRAITGENPAPPSSAGKVKEIARAWVTWGRERGLIE